MNIKDIKEEVLKNKKIMNIIEENNLSKKQIDESIHIFLDIIEEGEKQNLLYTSTIKVELSGMITRNLIPTQRGIKLENKNNFILRDITIMNFDLFPSKNKNNINKESEFIWNDDRKQLLDYFKKVILVKIKKDEYFKGIYLYGGFGIGKSFFTQSLANYIASKNKTVSYINNNDLATHLKQLFSVGYKKTIDKLKNVDFLFIDDIGSEKNSSWMLSEILFSILSYRMETKKTTFFTSNFSYNKLENEFIEGIKINSFKSKRLMERIEVLSTPILLGGKNWRKL